MTEEIIMFNKSDVESIEEAIKRLEQENKELSFAIEKCLENAGIECDDEEQALRSLPMLGNAHYKVLVEKEALEQENKRYKQLLQGCPANDDDCGFCVIDEQNKRLKQENKELKKQHYEALKMLKHEYDGRQRDNEQWFTRCTENHNEDSKIIEKYRSALEEIRDIIRADCKMCTAECDCDDDCTRFKIKTKINEVLK